jgi:hypothetical protein
VPDAKDFDELAADAIDDYVRRVRNELARAGLVSRPAPFRKQFQAIRRNGKSLDDPPRGNRIERSQVIEGPRYIPKGFRGPDNPRVGLEAGSSCGARGIGFRTPWAKSESHLRTTRCGTPSPASREPIASSIARSFAARSSSSVVGVGSCMRLISRCARRLSPNKRCAFFERGLFLDPLGTPRRLGPGLTLANILGEQAVFMLAKTAQEGDSEREVQLAKLRRGPRALHAIA